MSLHCVRRLPCTPCTLDVSLHCVRRLPCTPSTLSLYTLDVFLSCATSLTQWRDQGGGRGVTPTQTSFACQFENSYAPAFPRTLPPPFKNSWIRPCTMYSLYTGRRFEMRQKADSVHASARPLIRRYNFSRL